MRYPIANDIADSTRCVLPWDAIQGSTHDQDGTAHPIEIQYELAIRDLYIMTRYILGDDAFIKLLENSLGS